MVFPVAATAVVTATAGAAGSSILDPGAAGFRAVCPALRDELFFRLPFCLPLPLLLERDWWPLLLLLGCAKAHFLPLLQLPLRQYLHSFLDPRPRPLRPPLDRRLDRLPEERDREDFDRPELRDPRDTRLLPLFREDAQLADLRFLPEAVDPLRARGRPRRASPAAASCEKRHFAP